MLIYITTFQGGPLLLKRKRNEEETPLLIGSMGN